MSWEIQTWTLLVRNKTWGFKIRTTVWRFAEVKVHQSLPHLPHNLYTYFIIFLQPGPKLGRPPAALETGVKVSRPEIHLILCVKAHVCSNNQNWRHKKELCFKSVLFLPFSSLSLSFLFLLWRHTCKQWMSTMLLLLTMMKIMMTHTQKWIYFCIFLFSLFLFVFVFLV